jgi:hypothetical protein
MVIHHAALSIEVTQQFETCRGTIDYTEGI